MDTSTDPEPTPPMDARTRLRIVSVALNEATAELHKARHEVLFRRIRAFPARRGVPAWGAALIVGGIGAAIGAIPAMLVHGDNVLFVFVAICAAYTILSPATLLFLADRDGEDDSNRAKVREAGLGLAIERRTQAQMRVLALRETHREAREAVQSGDGAI